MTIKIEKYWDELETFDIEVIDPRGEIFMYKDAPWVMRLRAPNSDEVAKAVRKNADESARWRQRQPQSQRDGSIPSDMSERQMYRLVQASHVEWINAPVEEGTEVDFQSDDFVEFLKDQPWYRAQWERAWINRKNSTRLKVGQPKKNSSSGAKRK